MPLEDDDVRVISILSSFIYLDECHRRRLIKSIEESMAHICYERTRTFLISINLV
jgi:hypothetical protein